MAMTSMQIDSEVRDELAKLAEADLGGVSLGEAVRQLIMEHHIAHINRRYAELRADPEEWASYAARPAIVVGSAVHCGFPTDMALVIPLTTRDRGLRHHVRISSKISGLRQASWARTEGNRIRLNAPVRRFSHWPGRAGRIAELRQWLPVMVAF